MPAKQTASENNPGGGTAAGGSPAVAAPPEPIEGYLTALSYAWHRFNSYDGQSGHLKTRYQRIRRYIIGASLATTILSVLSVVEESARYWQLFFLAFGLFLFIMALRMVTGYQAAFWMTDRTKERLDDARRVMGLGSVDATDPANGSPQARRIQQIEQLARTILLVILAAIYFLLGAAFWLFSNGAAEIVAYRGEFSLLPPVRLLLIMLLIALPLLSSGLLDFAARFESRRNWIGFRLGAEYIRRSIYQLRVRSHYEDLTETDLDMINDVVKQARVDIANLGVSAPLLSENFDPDGERTKPAWTYVPEDDGYNEMHIDDYFRMRLTPQMDWYRNRIRRDYIRARHYRGWILLFGALGALLTAFNLSEFAAITAALVSAIVTWLALMAHEQNYRVYAATLAKLEEIAADYQVKEKIATVEDKLNFVNRVEQILADELDNWSHGVLQAQDVIEDSLGRMTRDESGEDLFAPEPKPPAEEPAEEPQPA
ncbi:MAG: SLATT domain-containing protein [Anaerolineae bacterium]|nr:SLATT domain-containing protein [Anaerolineae bacterium]